MWKQLAELTPEDNCQRRFFLSDNLHAPRSSPADAEEENCITFFKTGSCRYNPTQVPVSLSESNVHIQLQKYNMHFHDYSINLFLMIDLVRVSGSLSLLLGTEWITNENLLCSTGNSTQCSVVTYMGRKFKKEWLYYTLQLIHFAVQQKLNNIVKQLYSNKKIF